jgi:hypothetical protein
VVSLTSSISVVGYLDQDYRYKSVVTQIILTMLSWHLSSLPRIEPGTAVCQTVTSLCTTAADIAQNIFLNIPIFYHKLFDVHNDLSS